MDEQAIDLAFNKKKADDRKDWLTSYNLENQYIDYSVKHISIKDFINKEFINFSMADNMRSIGSIMDGLKPG